MAIPMLWFYHFPMVFLWFSHGFPGVNLQNPIEIPNQPGLLGSLVFQHVARDHPSEVLEIPRERLSVRAQLIDHVFPTEYPLETMGNHRKMWGNIYIYKYWLAVSIPLKKYESQMGLFFPIY